MWNLPPHKAIKRLDWGNSPYQRTCRWLFGCGLKYSDDEKASALGQIVTLQGIFWTSTLALIAYIQKAPDFAWSVFVTYVVLALLPIGGILVLFRARQDNERLLFDQATRMFGKWALVSTLLVVAVTGGGYYCNALPGQEPQEVLLPISKVEPLPFKADLQEPGITIKAGDIGLRAYIPFSPAILGRDRIPGRLVIDISLDPCAKNWQIAAAKGFVYSRMTAVDHDVDIVGRSDGSTKMRLHWTGLEPHEVYLLRVGLHRSEGGVPIEDLSAKIEKERDKIVVVKVYFRE